MGRIGRFGEYLRFPVNDILLRLAGDTPSQADRPAPSQVCPGHPPLTAWKTEFLNEFLV